MNHSARFWDFIAGRYANKPIADEATYQKKLEITRGYLAPHMELLELGCGTGSTAVLHAPHVRHIVAIDISEKMLQIARAQAQETDNITFRQSAIDEYMAADESFDVVLCLSLLHLLDDKDAVIARVYNMLRPGGLFVSNTTCIGDMQYVLRFLIQAGHKLGLLPPVGSFTAQQLLNSINSAGFDTEVQWQPGKGRAVFIVARKPL